jgi:hypothetical protein
MFLGETEIWIIFSSFRTGIVSGSSEQDNEGNFIGQMCHYKFFKKELAFAS